MLLLRPCLTKKNGDEELNKVIDKMKSVKDYYLEDEIAKEQKVESLEASDEVLNEELVDIITTNEESIKIKDGSDTKTDSSTYF